MGTGTQRGIWSRGTYYIRLAEVDHVGMDYRINFDTTEYGDVIEPNDDRGQEFPLSHTGHIPVY